ncbi:hypothetical protein AbHV_ORF112 [Abalone herpesvirus Victoria/AUS/2009]|uniref:Uncharacterized protein n=2 Tax=Herpesvirales TaxID=548681 RepID=K4JUN5_ABHV|nr:hypothetical protein AbHV_ORF112 [Abalone herpesvirus Victoria/AUS/2009]AFU90124.1 hypothetical protein AbHV_ORF112 [Abalone herpesvirus Victoria/AUS/2009]AMW36271.1 hypothetical protein tc2005_p127 [Abalone herpesvirus Taiwan/2005]UCX57099.1 108 [Haliotid herpesvirus 1]
MHRCKLIVRSPFETEPIISYEIKLGHSIEKGFGFNVEIKNLFKEKRLSVELYHDVVGSEEEVPVYDYRIRVGPKPRRRNMIQRAGYGVIAGQIPVTENKLLLQLKVRRNDGSDNGNLAQIEYEDLLIALPSSEGLKMKERRLESEALSRALKNRCVVCRETNDQLSLLPEMVRAFTTMSSSQDVCDFITRHKYVAEPCSLYDRVSRRVKTLITGEGSHRVDWIQTFCKDFRYFFVEGYEDPEVFLSCLARNDLTDCLRMVPGIPRCINFGHTFYANQFETFVLLLRKLFVMVEMTGKNVNIEFCNSEMPQYDIELVTPNYYSWCGEEDRGNDYSLNCRIPRGVVLTEEHVKTIRQAVDFRAMSFMDRV